MTALCVIPARGGSKGIPRKNMQHVAGRSLVARAVTTAVKATKVDRVVVSTDDWEIAGEAKLYGAEVVMRPPELATDTARSEDAVLHVLDTLRESEGYQPDLVVMLQCTSPLTAPNDIDGTICAMLEANADTTLSVSRSHTFIWRRHPIGGVVGVNHSVMSRPRRQDILEPTLEENGAVYVMRVAGFAVSRHRFFGTTAHHEMPAERSWEVDEPVDLQIAEVKARYLEARDRIEKIPADVQAVVFDFDGVMTDGGVYVREDGTESVRCDRSDGASVARLLRTDIKCLVLSSESNPVVSERCRKLGIACAHGVKDKARHLIEWTAAHGIDRSRIVYVGNDVNDTGCMRMVGCPVAVADAAPDVIRNAWIVLQHNGGHGAVRELCDLVMARKGAIL